MAKHIRILILEDNPSDAELLVRELRRAEFDFEWEVVDSEEAYLEKLHPGIDLILSDYAMPQFSGLRALQLLKERHHLEIPFIIVSGTIGEEVAVSAMQQGASDYLLKDRIARLGPAVRRALQQVEEYAERRRLEARFIEAQKMEVVGQLAGGVAHDFNNVLAVIMGYSDLIKQDLEADHPLQKYIEEVRQAAKRASGLTQQLLIFSRKQTVQAVELNLNEVIVGMKKMLQQLINENIEMTVNCREDIGLVKADSGYVWQVVMNLVVNARDAMPDGGKLLIETKEVTVDEAFASTHGGMTPGPYVVLRVGDTGIGMTTEVKARVFEAFFTTKAAGKGTGLGLVTCQTIVRQSGGYIEITTELGKGTTFDVYLPRVAATVAPAVGLTRKTAPVRIGNETILVVEDDPALRNLAHCVLKARGYHVLTASNGQDALRVAREHTSSTLQLVITDVVMPQMGGKVMAEWLKTSHPDLKILFTSGYTGESITHEGVFDAGVEFLPKPYTPVGLAHKVRELLDAAAPAP